MDKAVSDVKSKIDFKLDKTGIVHASIGKASFDADKIRDNADELLKTIIKLKPSTTKGTYVKSIFMSSTMSPSISIDTKIAILKRICNDKRRKSQVIETLTAELAEAKTLYLTDIAGLDITTPLICDVLASKPESVFLL